MEGSSYLPVPRKSLRAALGDLTARLAAGAGGAAAALGTESPEVGMAAAAAGSELIDALRPRAPDRAKRAIQRAEQRIRERIQHGHEPINDEESDPDDTLDLLEAAIRTAVSSVERRKADLVGSLLASKVFDQTVSQGDLMRYLRLIESLSWRQVLALAYFADSERASERELIAAGGSEGTRQVPPGLEAELSELARSYELIGLEQKDGSVSNPSDTMNGGAIRAANLGKTKPTGPGATLHRLCEMSDLISPEELDSFAREIAGDA